MRLVIDLNLSAIAINSDSEPSAPRLLCDLFSLVVQWKHVKFGWLDQRETERRRETREREKRTKERQFLESRRVSGLTLPLTSYLSIASERMGWLTFVARDGGTRL